MGNSLVSEKTDPINRMARNEFDEWWRCGWRLVIGQGMHSMMDGSLI